MKFYLRDEDGDWIQREPLFIYTPDYGKCPQLINWVVDTKLEDSTDLCRVLNSINAQGIEEVDCSRLLYKIKGKYISIPSMSTSEKIFFFSWLAGFKKQSVYLFRGIDQLTLRTRNLFFYTFMTSEFVNLVCEDSTIKHGYERSLRECIL